MSGALEITHGQERFFNYCLWEYEPPVDCAGKLAASNLLFESFRHEGGAPGLFELVDRIRAGIGVSNTVYGVKFCEGRISWEFYFYDYRRQHRERSQSAVIEAMRPLVGCDLRPNERLPYFMFSFDVDTDLVTGRRPLDEIHVYLGNVGSTVSSGVSYGFRATGLTLENFYFFFKPDRQMDEIVGKVRSSAYLESPEFPLESILWPEYLRCHTVCLANKRHNDCVYFSGIGVDLLIRFLLKMGYPDGLISHVVAHRDRLDHLLYDVGIDYVVEDGRLRILKTAYYGVF